MPTPYPNSNATGPQFRTHGGSPNLTYPRIRDRSRSRGRVDDPPTGGGANTLNVPEDPRGPSQSPHRDKECYIALQLTRGIISGLSPPEDINARERCKQWLRDRWATAPDLAEAVREMAIEIQDLAKAGRPNWALARTFETTWASREMIARDHRNFSTVDLHEMLVLAWVDFRTVKYLE